MYVYMKCVLTNDFMRFASLDPVHLRVGLGDSTCILKLEMLKDILDFDSIL